MNRDESLDVEYRIKKYIYISKYVFVGADICIRVAT